MAERQRVSQRQTDAKRQRNRDTKRQKQRYIEIQTDRERKDRQRDTETDTERETKKLTETIPAGSRFTAWSSVGVAVWRGQGTFRRRKLPCTIGLPGLGL